MSTAPGEDEELHSLLVDACLALKIFPLPGAIVFPGTPVPFHIFEPRYKAMTTDALAADRMIAIATLKNPDDASVERAEILPIAGAGFIEADEKLEDGRFNLVVRGLARVKLTEELTSPAEYRRFHAEILEDSYPPGGPKSLENESHTLEQCVLDLVQRLPPESGALQLASAATRCPNPSVLADLVAAAVITEPTIRYQVLAELVVQKRLELVTSEIAGVILMLSQGRGPAA